MAAAEAKQHAQENTNPVKSGGNKKNKKNDRPMTSAQSFKNVNERQAGLLSVQATEAKLNGQAKRKLKEKNAQAERNEKKIKLYIARKDAEAKRELDQEALQVRAIEARAKELDAQARLDAAKASVEAA